MVSTSPVTDILGQSVTCGGNIVSSGNLPITERGICWNTNPEPTIANYHAAITGTMGSFSYTITGLNNVYQYFVRAYAINTLGIAYGEEQTFITATPILTVSTNTIPDFGLIPVGTSSGIASFTVSGIYLADVVMIDALPGSGFELSLTDGRDVERTFSNNIILEPENETLSETTVFVRFIPLEIDICQSEISIFTVGAANRSIAVSGTGVVPPTLEIGIPFEVTQTSAQVGFIVWNDGFGPVSSCGICWNSSELPSISDARLEMTYQSGWMYGELSDILPNTTYYVRAYAVNIAGITYSGQSFLCTVSSPVVAVSDSLLTSFGGIVVGTFSGVDSFQVSGTGLVDDLIVSAPEGFQLSLQNRDGHREFSSLISLPAETGNVNQTTIYIRFSPTTPGILTNQVIVGSQGAVNSFIRVIGIGIILPEVTTSAA
ncbi:MAG: hypothetical protein U1B83_06670, partial [Candidatus Cloacimonadaceae bacterium]|nr:hypothetical protein [Candidatus Cloacimonadaceae bacterium]